MGSWLDMKKRYTAPAAGRLGGDMRLWAQKFRGEVQDGLGDADFAYELVADIADATEGSEDVMACIEREMLPLVSGLDWSELSMRCTVIDALEDIRRVMYARRAAGGRGGLGLLEERDALADKAVYAAEGMSIVT
jgi:hypothetical protein